jgi:DtxR family transcriptional regulator, Mn-dependent transcriptional regulator
MTHPGDTDVSHVTREYLETIYNLIVEGDPVVGVRLAEKFGVSAPNVAQTLRRMEKSGLIAMPGRGRGRAGDGIELTDEGRATAEKMLRQHRLAERFLVDIMGMDWVQAHEEAHNLERAMSPALEAQMLTLLGDPRTCPHGNPIPNPSVDTREYLRERGAMRLTSAEQGREMSVLLISEVVEDETALLQQLGQLDIMPGARVCVTSRTDDGSIEVRITPRGETSPHPRDATLPPGLAAKIWVRAGDSNQ